MAEKQATKKSTRKASNGFTAEEKAAMRERARELKAEANKEEGERDLLGKIDEMRGSDRAIAERIHAIVQETARILEKLGYG